MTNSTDLFLVTGASGNTGARTVRLLREEGLHVRAFVHTVDDRAARLSEQGAEVVQGDLLDFHSVSEATVGVLGTQTVLGAEAGARVATVRIKPGGPRHEVGVGGGSGGGQAAGWSVTVCPRLCKRLTW